MHKVELTKYRPSWSRMANVYDRIQPSSKADEYESVPSRIFTTKPSASHTSEDSLNLAERVELALKIEAETTQETEDLKEGGKGTSSFSSVSREQIARRNRSDSPPLGTYFPQFDYLLSKSPRIIFSRAKTRRPSDITPPPSGKILDSDFGPMKNSSFTSVQPVRRLQGVPFIKQTDRPHFVDPRKGPNENRFLGLKESRDLTRKVHAFAAYSPRRELFKLPIYSPDYTPKYNFLSKPRRLLKRNK